VKWSGRKTSLHRQENRVTRIERALIAVSDKTGIVEFAQGLTRHGVEILSTGGTARTLREGGIQVTEVAEFTGSPEILGGRVKTLHPKIHGGILARRDREDDRAQCAESGIEPIDLVVVNLYPFEKKVAEGITPEDAVEQIDIGGPTMIRAAAKNHAHVAVIVDPTDYSPFLQQLDDSGGSVGDETRRRLSLAAFRRTAAYDAAISNYFGEIEEGEFPSIRTEQWSQVSELRYGENPHQSAAWYSRVDADPIQLPSMTVHGGKALSYNNLLDAAAAIECAAALEGPGAVIVKHCLPCGAAEKETLSEAFDAALAGDPLSAFGGIVAFNQPLDAELAKRISTPKLFFEVIHASEFCEGAVELIQSGAKWGKNCRILEGGIGSGADRPHEIRAVPGAILMQQKDRPSKPISEFEVVTDRAPTSKRAGRSSLRLAGSPLREVEWDPPRPTAFGGRSGSRTTEPRRFGGDCLPKGGREERGSCPGIRCVLPLPRRSGSGCRRRNHRRHSTRGIEARPRGDRSRQPRRHRHDLHRRTTFPTLR